MHRARPLPSFARTLTPAFHFTLQEKLLKKLLPNGHKVLIFSQMTAMLDLLDAYFDERKIGCCRIDGSVSWQDRQAAMKRYDESRSDRCCRCRCCRCRSSPNGGRGQGWWVNTNGSMAMVTLGSSFPTPQEEYPRRVHPAHPAKRGEPTRG